MSTALALITEQVRERVRREGIDVGTESQLVDRFVRDEVRAYSERALGGSVPALSDEASATRQIVATLTGFGALQRFLDDESIEEIWINAPERVSSFDNEPFSASPARRISECEEHSYPAAPRRPLCPRQC